MVKTAYPRSVLFHLFIYLGTVLEAPKGLVTFEAQFYCEFSNMKIVLKVVLGGKKEAGPD